jgi:hypothetical protein
MLQGNEIEFAIVVLVGGSGFAIFAFRLLIVDNKRYTPRHSTLVGVDHVPPEYHPVYDRPNSPFENPTLELWTVATTKRVMPLPWFYDHCERKAYARERLAELRDRARRRAELSNWEWLKVPYREWADLWPKPMFPVEV